MGAIKVIGKILAGAALVVTGGTIVSVVDGVLEKEKLNKARQEGFEKGRANNTKTIIDLESKIKDMSVEINKLRGFSAFEDYITAAFALAISVANCDGDLCNEEIEAIEMIIIGESTNALPRSIITKINEFFIDMPTFNTAMKYVKKVDPKYYDSFDEIIREVIWSDGRYHAEEAAFIQAWNESTNRNINVSIEEY